VSQVAVCRGTPRGKRAVTDALIPDGDGFAVLRA
jgi:hypothetical protein